MYEAHSQRMAVVRVGELRNAMVSGVWSNSNYDDEKNTRETLLKRIDEFYDHAMRTIYKDPNLHVEAIDYDNDPFFAAMKRPQLQVSTESLGEVSER